MATKSLTSVSPSKTTTCTIFLTNSYAFSSLIANCLIHAGIPLPSSRVTPYILTHLLLAIIILVSTADVYKLSIKTRQCLLFNWWSINCTLACKSTKYNSHVETIFECCKKRINFPVWMIFGEEIGRYWCTMAKYVLNCLCLLSKFTPIFPATKSISCSGSWHYGFIFIFNQGSGLRPCTIYNDKCCSNSLDENGANLCDNSHEISLQAKSISAFILVYWHQFKMLQPLELSLTGISGI